MTQTGFIETEEQHALRKAVAAMAANYGQDYYLEKARSGGHTDELWNDAGKLGFIGVNLPEQYGGGGAGMYELSLVMEEMAAAGSPLLLMVVSPAINGTIIAKFGTEDQKNRWLPGIADGSITMAFAITEPDAGSNSHRITTTARRDGSEWILSGQKVFISGIDQAQAVLIVGRTYKDPGAKSESLRPALFIVPTDARGLSWTKIDMELCMPESQFQVFLDEARLPSDALVGSGTPRSPNCSPANGADRRRRQPGWAWAVRDQQEPSTTSRPGRCGRRRSVHQVSPPVGAEPHRDQAGQLMMQKAATLYARGDDARRGRAANMAKYAAGEASVRAVDQAVQSLGGNG
jgi:alkylation response protein AidB-like acyl-CoA dehydrogenase